MPFLEFCVFERNPNINNEIQGDSRGYAIFKVIPLKGKNPLRGNYLNCHDHQHEYTFKPWQEMYNVMIWLGVGTINCLSLVREVHIKTSTVV